MAWAQISVSSRHLLITAAEFTGSRQSLLEAVDDENALFDDFVTVAAVLLAQGGRATTWKGILRGRRSSERLTAIGSDVLERRGASDRRGMRFTLTGVSELELGSRVSRRTCARPGATLVLLAFVELAVEDGAMITCTFGCPCAKRLGLSTLPGSVPSGAPFAEELDARTRIIDERLDSGICEAGRILRTCERVIVWPGARTMRSGSTVLAEGVVLVIVLL